MAKYTAAVYGGSGFLGSEAVRRLLSHPAVELTHVYAADHIGQPLSAALPTLEGKTELSFLAVPDSGAPPNVDILLLALPHTASHRIVQRALDSDVRIIDMSGAFRVDNPDDYERFYGAAHPMPELLERFAYGLPELNRERLKGARFVASPGCFATAIELGLLPLARRGWLNGAIQTVGVTGSSGAGNNPTPTTLHATRANNLRAYRPLTHTHAPEIREALEHAGGARLEVNFVPVAAPLSRGILATSFASIPSSVTNEMVTLAFRKSYESEPFVVMPRSRLPEVVAVARSNYAEVGFALGRADATSGATPITCISAIDNLVKGGAGQAIQNLNLMFELDETAGLTDLASYP
jgi:N-acetyl-gamma-glutamyl-phosphate reductase